MATSTIKKASNVITQRFTLGTAQTANGNFLLEFDVAKSGWTPIGIVQWNFNDRSLAGKVFVTGTIISGTTAYIYGGTNASVTFLASVFIDVLYRQG